LSPGPHAGTQIDAACAIAGAEMAIATPAATKALSAERLVVARSCAAGMT
jgi:hypothetical protein